MSMIVHRLIVIFLGIAGIMALGLAALSAWDGVWLPALVLLPGIIAYSWSIWKRPT